MKPKTLMIIAGEASGDTLAAELVRALDKELASREAVSSGDVQPLRASLAPRWFGAGGPRLAEAGVELAFDLTRHSVIGISDVVKNYFKFRRLFFQLYRLALERKPEAIICVDFSGFNRRFAHAIKQHVRTRRDWFHNWDPKIVQYVSPQVWASREGRARQMERDYDLLLSIFPFEKDWYARRAPRLPVEFVGHPMLDRYGAASGQGGGAVAAAGSTGANSPLVLLLPGSRVSELARHLPVLVGALAIMRATMHDLRARMVLPHESLVRQARRFNLPSNLDIRVGDLPESLREAGVAIASTGTVTMECAYFGVPTVALYKTSWSTYQIGKRIVTVKHLAMPNLLAGAEVYPEFVQHDATPDRIAEAALKLLGDADRRRAVQATLAGIVATLGGPGANRRAARAVADLILK